MKKFGRNAFRRSLIFWFGVQLLLASPRLEASDFGTVYVGGSAFFQTFDNYSLAPSMGWKPRLDLGSSLGLSLPVGATMAKSTTSTHLIVETALDFSWRSLFGFLRPDLGVGAQYWVGVSPGKEAVILAPRVGLFWQRDPKAFLSAVGARWNYQATTLNLFSIGFSMYSRYELVAEFHL